MFVETFETNPNWTLSNGAFIATESLNYQYAYEGSYFMGLQPWYNYNNLAYGEKIINLSGAGIKIKYYTVNTYYIAGRGTGPVRVKINGNIIDEFNIYGTYPYTERTAIYSSNPGSSAVLRFENAQGDFGQTIDYIRIWQYTFPEPLVSIGAEPLDTIAPDSITNLTNTTYASTYINWTWTDPQDPDFAKLMVYLNGAYQNDVPKGVQYYNATVSPGTYTIGTRTVDINGNINATMMTNTATTILPPVRFINGTVIDCAKKTGILGVTVSTNTNLSTMTNETGFYSLAVVAGKYNLTARFEPTYYLNSSVTVSTEFSAVVVHDIELVRKPTGNITGSITKST